jgi:photosynthetic reaction center cytochrome c subunit
MNPTRPISSPAQVSMRVSILVLSVAVVCLLIFEKRHVNATTSDLKRSRVFVQTPKSEQGIKLAEQVYKNIQIFKGMPASDLEPTMAFISGSLGVKCNHCHTNPFDKDEKPTKQTARQMIRMVLDLNKGSFRGEKAVSCFTCHRGKPQPVSVPAVGQNLWQSNPAAAKETPLPTIEEILSRYVQAVGGEANIRKINSRVAKGSRIGADGVLVPEEVYQKAPNKIVTVTSYPDVSFSTGFNGSAGWGSSSKGERRELPAPVLAQIKSDAEFYKEIKMKELYRSLGVIGKSTIGDKEVYVVRAVPAIGDPERLYFDVQTGLLVRRYVESELFLGMFPLQTDYEDYREVDGIRQPFLIRWSMPGRSWGRKIVELKQNVAIDDTQFNPPPAAP